MTIEAMKLDFLEYNPSTGLFVWNEKAVPRVRGKQAGNTLKTGQVQIKICGKAYYAHRIAWLKTYGKWPDNVIDHINGNPTDNRLCNLRDVPQPVNMQNQKSARTDSKSGVLGVMRSGNKWRAMIRLHGKGKHLGVFETPELAHAAYVEAKRKYHIGGTL